MTERELFVKKYREVFNVDKSLFVNNDGKFQDEFCQKVYEIWQAATQREGFRLVPVEPALKMSVAKFKDMKIEINAEQPLNEVVAELERLGCKPVGFLYEFRKKYYVCSSIVGRYTTMIKPPEYCELTTLTELKGMTNG